MLLSMPTRDAMQVVDPLDDLFARGRSAQAAIKTLSASFTETTASTLLRDPLIATGTLVAALPIRVVMNYGSPSAKTVALDEARLVVVWPSRGQREEINIAATQRRVRKYFTDATPKQLRETFTVTLSSDAAFHQAYVLDLIPKRKEIAEGLRHLRLWIDRTRFVMLKLTMDYPGGDSKTLELHDIRTNVAIDESTFALLARRK